MTDAAVISARYCGRIRIVNSRKAVVVEVETDIAHIQHVLDVLGVPATGDEVPVALCRLTDSALRNAPDAQPAGDAPPPVSPATPKQRWEDMRPSVQAGILSEDPDFAEYLLSCRHIAEPNRETAIRWIRSECGVRSRRDLDADADAAGKWRGIAAGFQAWRTTRRYQHLER